MAGVKMSNRELWQFITGSSLTKPKELVSNEINKHEDRLKQGLKFYKIPRCPAGELLSKDKQLDSNTVDFLKKLTQFLGLDEVQSHELYKQYIHRKYRGTQADLQTLLTTDRHSQTLIGKLRDFYHNERLYLLRSVKHILSFWQEEKHPFYTQYKTIAQKLYKTQDFITCLLQQYDMICEAVAPTWETNGRYMNERHSHIWVIQNLREQCELLEILMLYYSGVEMAPPTLLDLANKFKRQGFGRRQTNRHLLEEHAEVLLHRIGFLQVILLVEGLDLEDLLSKQNRGDHHLIKHAKFESLDQYFESLGQCAEHGPLLLAWAGVRELSGKGEEARTAILGNKSLAVKVFPYITTRLKSEPFCGKSVTAKLCHTLVYGLMCSVLEAFHHDTLGDREDLLEVATILLKQRIIAEDFWKIGMDTGLGPLFQLACSYFPLDLTPLVDLCVSLAQAGQDSAHKVVKILQNMGSYMEVMSNASEVKATRQQNLWELLKDRRPYHNAGSELLIPRGTIGEYQSIGGAGIVQWQCGYDAWDVFIGEINLILQQIAHGQGMVQTDRTERVSAICSLFHSLLLSAPTLVHSDIHQVAALMPLIYQVIQRFSQVLPPPLQLLAACVKSVHQLALHDPVMVWRRLKQTGLLPTLTENLDNLAEVASGAGLNSGVYDVILAGTECTCGQYPLTIALLDLISALIQRLSQRGEVELLLPSIMYVTREIFPVFSKWRYYNLTHRELIGQKCLEIFHKVLNLLGQEKSASVKVTVRQVCIYSLLYTEAGQALLDIAATSVDTVNTALASQSNATEGAGVELIQMIRIAFSVLNRLLLLRPAGAPQSPVEHSLSAQGSGLGGRKNTMATIAQYIYHRHDPRLATLATVLLKRLAVIFPMSILACLGDEAEPIRDVFLSRLQSDTEDVRLKVVILEFLSTCVDTQPGLIEIFLNVKSINKKPGDSGKEKIDSRSKVKNSVMSCLQTVLHLIQDKKQGTYECPSQLLCAAIEFIHALWHGHRETAMVALREKAGFWHCVCLSLTRELQPPTEAESDLQVLQREVLSCADIMKILALELYHNQGSKLDDNLKNVLSDILSKGRLLYWSKYLRDSLLWSSTQCEEERLPGDWSQNAPLQLLLAWRNLLLVLNGVSKKVPSLHVPDTAKEKILSDILKGLSCQFGSDRELSLLNMKLSSVSSAFYITLLRQWVSTLDSWSPILQQVEGILSLTMSCCETIIPSVQIGLLGALTLILQHARESSLKSLDPKPLASLVPIVCSLIQQCAYQLPSPPKRQTTQKTKPKVTKPGEFPDMSVTGIADVTAMSSQSRNISMQTSILDESRMSVTQNRSRVDHMEVEPISSDTDAQSDQHKDVEVRLKLVTSSLCLLEELIRSLPTPEYWLPEVKQYSLLQTLLASIETWILAHQGAEYVHTVFMLLLTLTKHPQSAETLAVGSFIQQLCLVMSHLYNHSEPTNTQINKHKTTSAPVNHAPSWLSIYCVSLSLFTSLLDCLKYNFLKFALEFVGVHQDRMHQCLSSVGLLLHDDILDEASRTCHYLSELSVYRREWRLQLPQVLRTLMTDVCMVLQSSVSLLIRPNLLQHMLERQASGQDIIQMMTHDKFLSTPLIRSMSQQPDDSDHPPQDVVHVQNRLLSIVSHCLISLRKFSPDLCEIVLDQSLDVSEYEGFLQLGFSTPSIEHDTPPTFGTLVSCVSLCLFLLNKAEPKTTSGTPPGKHDAVKSSSKPETERSLIEKTLIMFVLENALYLIMSQAIRCLKDPSLHSRDKQLVKRELSAELNSFLSGMQRYLRRGSGAHTPSSSHQGAAPHSLAEANYLKLVNVFVRKVLR